MNNYLFASILMFVSASTSMVFGSAKSKFSTLEQTLEVLSLDQARNYRQRAGYKKMAIDHFGGNASVVYDLLYNEMGIDYINKLGWGEKHFGLIGSFKDNEVELQRNHRVKDASFQEAISAQVHKLEWGDLYGDSDIDLRLEREKVFKKSADGKFKSEKERLLSLGIGGNYIYAGAEGYDAYSNQFYRGSMKKPFDNAERLLTRIEFDKLGWGKVFIGTVYKYRQIRYLIFGSPKNYDYGIDNWFGEKKGLDNLTEAYLLLSKESLPYSKRLINTKRAELRGALDKTELKLLGFRPRAKYPMIAEIKEILASDLNKKYFARAGRLQLAIEHFDGNLLKAHMLTLEAIGKEAFSKLEWELRFDGYIDEYEKMREFIFGPDQSEYYAIKYWHIKHGGLQTLLEKYLQSKSEMKPFNKDKINFAKQKLRAALSYDEKSILEWYSRPASPKLVYPTTSKIKEILLSDVNHEYVGVIGRSKFATDYFYMGNIREAYERSLKAVGKEFFLKLNWERKFLGFVSEYTHIRFLIFGPNQSENYAVSNWYGSLEGLTAISEKFLESKGIESPFTEKILLSTQKKIISALSKEETILLGWVASTKKYRKVATPPVKCIEVMK